MSKRTGFIREGTESHEHVYRLDGEERILIGSEPIEGGASLKNSNLEAWVAERGKAYSLLTTWFEAYARGYQAARTYSHMPRNLT